MSRHQDDEPTHTIPMALQRKLVEARRWSDGRMALEEGRPGSDDVVDEWERSDAAAVTILNDIVEMCEQAWGFAE